MEPLRLFGIPVSGIGYYMNWVLTNAQIELIAADVSVVDYDYDKDKKKGKGEFDDTKADSSAVRKANEQWIKEHGDGEGAGWVDLGSILGSGMKQDVGVNIE